MQGKQERTPRLQHKFRSQPSWKSKNLSKPQLKFKVKPDNMDESPFRPLLTAKPHAIVPLQDSFQPYTNEDGREQYDLLPYDQLTRLLNVELGIVIHMKKK